MTSAYRLLYQIETHLKQLIEQSYIRAYGPHWHQRYKIPINLKYPRYSDLINILQTLPQPTVTIQRFHFWETFLN